ncbi:MAG: flagellar type III secretion system pore protein FliP [Planctomycetaceae bacterium]|nr:flagellar type III secretion system pore protein FliP [Planctomycetaceae bacterium]
MRAPCAEVPNRDSNEVPPQTEAESPKLDSSTTTSLKQVTKKGDEITPLQAWRKSRSRRALVWLGVILACLTMLSPAVAQDTANRPLSLDLPEGLAGGPKQWTSPEGLSATLQVMLLLTVLSLAPAVLMMTTCFVRVVVVLGILRQAIGTQQLPPSQVITTLALFITLLVMAPVWKEVYQTAIVPYTNHEISMEQAWDMGQVPIRRFMSMQIERAGNTDDVYLFLSRMDNPPEEINDYSDVPLTVLLPAYMVSELKVAFLIGFQIYLPFLIIDMVIASVMVSMGMLMLPPVLISMPFKIMLFVLLDGWNLVVGMLMDSVAPYT